MFLLAMVGVVLMVVETELYLRAVLKKTDMTSITIKCFISGTTVVLLVTICMNYYIGARIRALDAGVKSLSSVMTSLNWFLFGLELLLCSVHPIPGDFNIRYSDLHGKRIRVSLDAVLSFLMIARFYLVGKFVAAHSRLLTDPFLHCIDTVSKIKLNTLFYVKVTMIRYPFSSLIVIMMSSILINTWAMRACKLYHESYDEVINLSYLDAMWMVAIPFLSLGYGEGYPTFFCRRYITVFSSIFGKISTALIVVFIWKHFARTRMEEFVFTFVSRVQISLRKKQAAANIIKKSILLWMSKHKGKTIKHKISKINDDLNRSLKVIQETKRDMEDVSDDVIGYIDIYHVTERLLHVLELNSKWQDDMNKKILKFNQRLQNIEKMCDNLIEVITKGSYIT